jgi:hypothetical protein
MDITKKNIPTDNLNIISITIVRLLALGIEVTTANVLLTF